MANLPWLTKAFLFLTFNALLGLFAVKNGYIWYGIGFYLFAAGTLLNFLAVLANNGKMPVAVKNKKEWQMVMQSPMHSILTPESHLKCLADKYHFGSKVLSIGDIILYATFIAAILILINSLV